MSITQTKKSRSSVSSLQQRSRNRNHTSGGGNTPASSSRSSNRQTKVTNHGFYFGEAQAAERDIERIEREHARERKRREQRLEELERGNAPSSSWNDSSSLNIPAASTSAAAIAGLFAGRQAAEQETGFDDILATTTASTTSSGSKKKQSAELRRLLTQRRSLKLLLEDAAASPVMKTAPIHFLQSLHVQQRYPIHRATGPVCSICGYWGDIRCKRCHERVCGLKCGATHDETRCDRPI